MKKSPFEYSFYASAELHGYKIVTPETSVVSTDKDVKFIYVMRKDSDAVCQLIADKITAQYHIPKEQIQEVIAPIYNRFVDGLAHIMGKNFLCKGKTEIHLFSFESIEAHRSSYMGQKKAISLDPLIQEDGVETIGLSRGYLPGGVIEIGMMPRPGFPSLHDQILSIKDKMTFDEGIDIFEDDIYTGGSLTRVVDMLAKEGIDVKRIIPGIQVGKPQALLDRGIEIHPAIQYHMNDGQDIDLGDPRDFLLGADGLVVLLNGMQLGRLPYIAPFVSPAARLSIPKENEKDFSRDVLMLNRDFFAELEQGLAIACNLNHMSEVSAFALETLKPEWKEARLVDIIDDVLDQYDGIKSICDYHKDRSAIKIMELPKKVIFLDVNGTILPAGSEDGHIEDEDLHAFQAAVEALEKTGAVVGLNSDSPLPQLQAFAQKIGIPEAPILAENGSILSYKGKTICLREFDGLSGLKDGIQALAEKHGISRAADVVAPEFGGTIVEHGKWAFGASRTSSLSIFAGGGFLKEAKAYIDNNYDAGDVSCDLSPEHMFLGVHPGKNFQNGKSETLLKLVREGHEIVSIGDSLSDYVPFSLPNRVVFVKDGLPADILAQPHVSVSKKKGISGITETLKYMAQQSGLSMKSGLSHDI